MKMMTSLKGQCLSVQPASPDVSNIYFREIWKPTLSGLNSNGYWLSL